MASMPLQASLGTTRVASTCLNWLTLASYSWKGNSTEWADSYQVESNCSGKPLITDFGSLPWLVGRDKLLILLSP